MVKVLLERRVRKENYDKLMEYLRDLRSAALRQPGYVTGETLVKGTDPIDVLVISSWISEEHWKAWACAQPRIELEDMIDRIIVKEPQCDIYRVPVEEE